jgi:pimeloyl-ACP methyl ester carboxylesterase
MSHGGDANADDGRDLSVPATGGVTLHVRHWPRSGSPAFLLVHGLASSARLWDEVAAELTAAGHPVYAVDLRGHGESETPEDGYDATTAVADLATVSNALGLTGAVVAGHSWGGNVTVRLAAEHPGLVAALALVDGGWIDPTTAFGTWDECAATFRPPELDGASAEGVRGYLRGAHPDWSPRAIEAAMSNVRVAPDGSVTRRLSKAQHMSIVRSMWDDPPSRWFAAVAAPVLMLPVISTTYRKRAAMKRMWLDSAAAAIPRVTTREYLDADHDLPAQQPRRLAGDLLELARTAVAERAAPAASWSSPTRS